MARRESSRPERLILATWLAGFRDEFCATMQIEPDAPGDLVAAGRCRGAGGPLAVAPDSSGTCARTRSSTARASRASEPIELRVGRLASTARPFLEVADRGPGIASQHRERIFEPFFTGNERGTGLGLFLARELAQTNGATLLYEPRTSGGSLFRIVFRDPERWVA